MSEKTSSLLRLKDARFFLPGTFSTRHLQSVFYSRQTLAVLCCLLALPTGAQKRPPAKKTEKPPVVEKLTEKVYRVGKAVIDMEARTVTCFGAVNMDDGAVEYLAVAPGGKLHESVLRLDVRPLHWQVALLLLDLEPKNVLKRQGEKKTPEGAKVLLRVRWRDKNGETREVPAESLVVSGPKDTPLSEGAWVFTGSRILKEGFEADLSKSLTAVWHDPAAIIDNPRASGAANSHAVNTRLVPRRGTRIEFIVQAMPPEGKRD